MTANGENTWRAQLTWAAGIWALGTISFIVLGGLYGLHEEVTLLPWTLIAIGKLVAIRVLWSRGTFKTSRSRRVAGLSLGMIILGALFKIQHWPGADALLILGFTALVITYCTHYALKASKRWSDHLKAVWVVVSFSAALIRVEHWSSIADPLNYVAILVFWGLVFAYMREHAEPVGAGS